MSSTDNKHRYGLISLDFEWEDWRVEWKNYEHVPNEIIVEWCTDDAFRESSPGSCNISVNGLGSISGPLTKLAQARHGATGQIMIRITDRLANEVNTSVDFQYDQTPPLQSNERQRRCGG